MSLSILRPVLSCRFHLQRLTVRLASLKRFRYRNSSSVSRMRVSSAAFAQLQSCVTNRSSLEPPTPSSQVFDDEDVYRYTSGRWLWDEKEQLSRRYVKFNMTELTRVAVQATGSKSCTEVHRLPEGNFNRVFLITMDDGKEVIAKLPSPNAGRAYFTTACEVATMNYVRDMLDIPTPKVYAWSASTENPVGAEYIIMERSPGIELSKVWDDLTGPDKYQIVKKLVEFDKTFLSTRFPMYGSLYYANDLPEVLPGQLVNSDLKDDTAQSVFAVGPTTDRTFFDDGRDAVDVNRGPWSSPEDYLLSQAHRELACLQMFSKFPRQQGLFSGPGQYQPSKESKTETLHNYIKVARFLLPQDKMLSKPIFWHPDLHEHNIFVNLNNPTEICSIIDWQAVNLSPLYLQAGHPALIDFKGPIPEGLQPIDLPEDFDSLTPEEQLAAKKLRAAQSLYKLYEIELLKQCPIIFRALQFRDSLFGHITGSAGSIFNDGELFVQELLMMLQEEWSICVGPSIPCPLSFTAEDKKRQREDMAKWSSGVELMGDFLNQVGAYRGWDGWVDHDNYEVMKERLERCRDDFLTRNSATDEEKILWMKVWPFMDK